MPVVHFLGSQGGTAVTFNPFLDLQAEQELMGHKQGSGRWDGEAGEVPTPSGIKGKMRCTQSNFS